MEPYEHAEGSGRDVINFGDQHALSKSSKPGFGVAGAGAARPQHGEDRDLRTAASPPEPPSSLVGPEPPRIRPPARRGQRLAGEPEADASSDPLDNREPTPLARALRALDQMRVVVAQRLDALEKLAQEPTRGRDLDSEQRLREQSADLERQRQAFQAEAERWDRERHALIEQLEHDRRLLADAWERLEQEQLQAQAQSGRLGRPTPAGGPGPRSGAAAAAPVALGLEDPVAQAVLRQFQALRRDVQRNASGPSRDRSP
jgi:hypothetical protein